MLGFPGEQSSRLPREPAGPKASCPASGMPRFGEYGPAAPSGRGCRSHPGAPLSPALTRTRVHTHAVSHTSLHTLFPLPPGSATSAPVWGGSGVRERKRAPSSGPSGRARGGCGQGCPHFVKLTSQPPEPRGAGGRGLFVLHGFHLFLNILSERSLTCHTFHSRKAHSSGGVALLMPTTTI